MKPEIIKKAIEFAKVAHEGQVRKYTYEPYVTHPIAVAKMFEEAINKEKFDEETINNAIAAAVLHDTVEDCDVTYEDIIEEFNEEVAKYVYFLTKPENFVGNRAVRKALDRARLKEAPAIVKVIKVCDLIHNSGSIIEHDPDFAKVFKTEALQLIAYADFDTAVEAFCKKEFYNEFNKWDYSLGV